MNNEQTIENVVTLEKNEVDSIVLDRILKRIIDEETKALFTKANDEQTKKKIMKIIEEEIKCY